MESTIPESKVSKRETAKGLTKNTFISVARDGRRRVTGEVISVFEDAKHGLMVKYRSYRNAGVYTTEIANVRVDRDIARRRKAVKNVP